MVKLKGTSEGVRRLSLAVAIVATIASFIIINNISLVSSDSPRILLPSLLGSALIGGASWSLVRLVAWTVAGFTVNAVVQPEGLKVSKYDPLYRYLSAQKGPTVTMTFSQIETVIGSELPQSARKYGAWWANADPETGQHPYSQAWMLAGMRAAVNLTAESVVFERLS